MVNDSVVVMKFYLGRNKFKHPKAKLAIGGGLSGQAKDGLGSVLTKPGRCVSQLCTIKVTVFMRRDIAFQSPGCIWSHSKGIP